MKIHYVCIKISIFIFASRTSTLCGRLVPKGNLSRISFLLSLLLFQSAFAAVPANEAAERKRDTVAFTLLKGKGIAVCEAYLNRLNASGFGALSAMPICGRPENDSVDGFRQLNRVPLTADQISELWESKRIFMSQGNRGNRNSLTRGAPSTFKPGTELAEPMKTRGLSVWRYDPPVDIDNDGTPDDDLVVWSGDLNIGPCGRPLGDNGRIVAPSTYILSIDWKNNSVNEVRTREWIGHPQDGYPIIKNGKPTGSLSGAFRPIGSKMGIFDYQGTFYFDTFFSEWGDFEGKRGVDSGASNKSTKHKLEDTLGVFERRNGITKQVCEFRWNEFKKYFQ